MVAKNSIFQIKENDRRIYLFGTKESRDSWSKVNEGGVCEENEDRRNNEG